MAGTSPPDRDGSRGQPFTPPKQSILASADLDFSPTMSPGDFVRPRDVDNPFGFGPALPGSIAVRHDGNHPVMSASGATNQPTEPEPDSDSNDEDENNRKKRTTKKTGGDDPVNKKTNDKSPGGGNAGGNASSSNMTDNQNAADHQTNTDGDGDVDMSQSTPARDAGAREVDDELQVLSYTPTKKPQRAPSSHDVDLAIPSVESKLVRVPNSLQERGGPQDTTTSTKLGQNKLTYSPHIVSRDRSAPPASLGTRSDKVAAKVDYVNRINPTVLPPPGTPLHTEIINYLQRLSVWSAYINDPERRDKVLIRICEVLYRIWNEGIKHGLIPKRVPVGTELQCNEEIQGILETEIAREKQAKLNKKLPDPAKIVMVEIKRYIPSDSPKFNDKRKFLPPPDYSITAGELAEAGVKWSNVEARLTSGDFDSEHLLVQRATANLPRRAIVPSQHWQRVKPKTLNNPIGRDLKYYCLWEVFRCDAQIQNQENLLEMVKTGDEEHRAVVEATIADEQKLRAQLLAIALELDPETKTSQPLIDEEDEDDEDDDDDDRVDQDHPKNISSQPRERSIISVSAESSHKSTPVREIQAPVAPNPIPRSNPSAEIRVMTTRSKNPKAYFKQRAFYQDVVIPKANELLKLAGREVLEDHIAGWHPISDALKAAKISLEKRNDLAMEINLFVHGLDSTMDESKVTDVPGYPTRSLIWQTIPPHGFTGEELKGSFPNMHAGDLTWQKLVLSVASYRHGRLFPDLSSPDESDSTPLPPGFRPSLSVRLALRKQDFDPEEYSSRTVNNSKGFRWRYTNTSTLGQRAAMDNHIENFVNTTIETDRAYTQANSGKPAPRNGRYDILVLPNDPDGGGVVHGLWDVSKGRQVSEPCWQWFYDGEVKDVTAYLGYKSYEPIPEGSMAEIMAWYEDRKQKIVASSREQAGGAVETTISPVQGKDGNQKLLKLNAPITPPSTKGKTKAKAASSGSKTPKGKPTTTITPPTTPTRRGGKASGGVRGVDKKRKSKQEHEDSPRPKRTAGRALRYAEFGDDEGDEDFEENDDTYDEDD